MRVLIIKNVFSEGPGTIADHLDTGRSPYSVIDLSAGDAVPDLGAFTHVLIMGGPMAVYEMDRYSYLRDEARLIERAINTNKHVMGVCLGAQMVAHVLGARVYPGSKKEIGWYEVSLTSEGVGDPCLSALALPDKNAAQVFQWHGDTFDLPAGARRFASSDLYPNQAFGYGGHVYALQFHIEVTPAIVRNWLAAEEGIDREAISKDSERIFGAYRGRAEKFYERFFQE